MPSPLLSATDLRERFGTAVVIDARPDAAAYAAGHLVGALHADLERTLSTAADRDHDPKRGGRHPLPSPAAFAQQVGLWGIGPEADVVVYDAASGANAAARLWWMLRSIGHDRVQVLDGGLAAAVAAGCATDSVVPHVTAPISRTERLWKLPTVTADIVDVRRRLSEWNLLDVRSRERFRGDHEPMDPVPGHIPGAANIPFTENLNPDGRFKTPSELTDLYAGFVDSNPKTAIVMCGSGVTACHTLLALEHAGLHGAALYVGSWSEWCRSDYERATGQSKSTQKFTRLSVRL